jgi:hypothetical protein
VVTSWITALKGRIVRGQRRVLDQHDLALVVEVPGETGLDDLVGLAGLAHVGVGGLEILGGDCRAGHDGRDHEGKPAEHGRLPVARAPGADAVGEVARLPALPWGRLGRPVILDDSGLHVHSS